MTTKKLEQWANLLLDTGKRNNLINFKETKASTVEVLLPDTETLLAKAESSASFEVFQPKLQPQNEEALEYSNQLSRSEYLAACSGKIRRSNQILLYNPWNDPVAALKNIHKKAASAIEETGVNVAYISFGFIHWKEHDGSSYRAPILLSPVILSNTSAIHPYHVKMTEDELLVNPTFQFKLKTEYGITLPPYEDEGLTAYLAAISEIVGKLGWTVSSESFIGIFSFLKLNMYQDLTQNAQTILRNANVRMLLGEPYEANASAATAAPRLANPLVELHTVVDADSSQMEAIEMTRSGMSFVLQGPPGTGKSQTITNIIAQCLHEGKKVLFVSEKLAALNVVYDKLKNAGLSEFCLELHSYKANKKDIIEELCHTLRTPKTTVSSRAGGEIDQKLRAQQELDAYEQELHCARDRIHMSLYQLYNAFSACGNVPETGYVIPSVTEQGEQALAETVQLLEQYVSFVPSIGYDYRTNCWYGFSDSDVSFAASQSLKEDMQTLAEAIESLIPISEEISSRYGIRCDSLRTLTLWNRFFRTASTSSFLTPTFLQKTAFASMKERLQELSARSQSILALKKQIAEEYDTDIYRLPAAAYHKKLERQFTGTFIRLFQSEYRGIINELRLCRTNGRKPSYQDALAITALLADYQAQMEEFIACEEPVKLQLGSAYAGIQTDWNALYEDVSCLEELYAAGTAFGQLSKLDSEELSQNRSAFASYAEQLEEPLSVCQRAADRLSPHFDSTLYDLNRAAVRPLMNKLDDCMQGMDAANDWCRFYQLLLRLQERRTDRFLTEALAKKLPADRIVTSYRKSFYRQWIEAICRSTPVLAGFSRISHDQSVAAFAQKDELQFAISKSQIRSELSAARPSLDMISSGSALSILLREGEKKRKQKSIRALLEETGELVQRIKPCFLMSPLSVSTFLSSDAVQFDVVIFDEASQIFPQDAIGAIYRGKQLIVVGDSKQMPPSNFFSTTAESDEEEESSDVSDFESILDLCSASLPQLRLKWHYRSRYEQLINFSNRNFYDSDLVTFPSASVDHEGIGVDYFYVDGQFEHKSRVNRKEAEFVVDLIYRHIAEHPDRSLGVVAFSIAQQELIDRLLSKRRQSDPSCEWFFAADQKEPFFVKNLETVQGDERDTILFSVAYAKDAKGVLMHNFGPLNRAGGERRLNVAVTRAKLNIQLVTSLHHTDIDLKRTQAEGARLLRAYLDYAENSTVAFEQEDTVSAFEGNETHLEQEIAEFLRENGYTVDTQVGCSALRIDIGLRRPDSSDYVLAIECDGATYHSAKNARDRDRLRQSILERMGWHFYRIWSTDWFRNTAVEKKRLLEAAEQALAAAEKAEAERMAAAETAPAEEAPAPSESVSEETVFEEEAAPVHFEFPKYHLADLQDICSRMDSYPLIVREILETEAPLSEEWLLKRTAFLFNRSKVTAYVQEEYQKQMAGCSVFGITRRDGFLYLKDQDSFMLRVPDGTEKREIHYIAPEELAAGILTILRQNVSADREGLYLFLAKQLGYTRVGEAIHAQMNAALSRLEDLVEIDGERLSCKAAAVTEEV